MVVDHNFRQISVVGHHPSSPLCQVLMAGIDWSKPKIYSVFKMGIPDLPKHKNMLLQRRESALTITSLSLEHLAYELNT